MKGSLRKQDESADIELFKPADKPRVDRWGKQACEGVSIESLQA